MIKLKTLKDFENSKWLDNNMPYGESSEGYEKGNSLSFKKTSN